MSLEGIARMPTNKLEKMVRPSGYYRQKAERLKRISSTILGMGGMDKLFSMEQAELRKSLLDMKGIGMETADSIILYAAEKPTFVIDSYTLREMSRIFGTGTMAYTELKDVLEGSITKDVKLYKDMHAQFVELGKNYCLRTNPLCAECPVNGLCHYPGYRNVPVLRNNKKPFNRLT